MEPLPVPSEGAPHRFTRRFRERLGGAGPVSFAAFMELALFDSEVGYYAARRIRVGRGSGADFVTASTFSAAFSPLVAAATEHLVGGTGSARGHTFVEIGAEPGHSVLGGVAHGFADVMTLRLGDTFAIPSCAVVFSNELFDAQPFHRLVWRANAWRELGVALQDAIPVWTELPALSPKVSAIRSELPLSSSDGYILDVPRGAVDLLERIAAAPWTGLFLALDYGRTWRQICDDFPQGTGRAYSAQRQVGDLLANPGAQDLTCHLCWDWLESALGRAGFSRVTRESQEAFFVHHATAAIESIMRGDASPLSPRRSQLKQLLHPGLMGHRFEALWALRS
jgi:SAM-dependent MidA family methyltransferase